jgi:hypothetical protein
VQHSLQLLIAHQHEVEALRARVEDREQAHELELAEAKEVLF